jgi:hypothetical protein
MCPKCAEGRSCAVCSVCSVCHLQVLHNGGTTNTQRPYCCLTSFLGDACPLLAPHMERGSIPSPWVETRPRWSSGGAVLPMPLRAKRPSGFPPGALWALHRRVGSATLWWRDATGTDLTRFRRRRSTGQCPATAFIGSEIGAAETNRPQNVS